MANSDRPPSSPSAPPGDPTTPPDSPQGKRRWKAPQIQSGQLFEANSLACFKGGPTSEECLQAPPFKS